MKTTHLIADVMRGMTDAGTVDDTTHQRIEEWPCDFDLKRLIQWHWFLKDVTVGPVIFSAPHITDTEREAGNLARGLLQIGSCPNGDEIHLRADDFAVLYWSHDESTDWPQKRPNEFHLAYRAVDHLLIAIRNRAFVPIDSYSARDYFQLLNRKD
jgi:hypothetical protein